MILHRIEVPSLENLLSSLDVDEDTSLGKTFHQTHFTWVHVRVLTTLVVPLRDIILPVTTTDTDVDVITLRLL